MKIESQPLSEKKSSLVSEGTEKKNIPFSVLT